MNAVIYKLAYIKIGVVERFGHRAPMFVLNYLDRRWKTLNEIDDLHKHRRINVDQYDVLTDTRCVLSQAMTRKVHKK
jgi:hypothetical protein